MSNETFVAFATQKGGIGKSTVTALAANYLHNVKGHNVAVIDCDAPQHSIHGLRERETGLIGGSLYFKALACDHFRKIRKNAYPVIASDALNALDDAERMLAEEKVKPDVVFFDMPGTLKSNGVVKTLSQMDYIFAPMSADRFVVESTLQFAVMFRDNLMTTGQAKTKGLYLFWTMVDGREKNGLYDLWGCDSRDGAAGAVHPPARQQEVPARPLGRAQERVPLDHLPDGCVPAERKRHP